MSIKWKITLSLIIVSICLVSVYIVTATRVFEHDKISYIFEDQQTRLQNNVKSFNDAIEDALWFSKLLFKDQIQVENKDQFTPTLSAQKFIDAAYIFDTQTKTPATIYSRKPGAALNADLISPKVNPVKTQITHYEGSTYAIIAPIQGEAKSLVLPLSWMPEDAASASNQTFFYEDAKTINTYGKNLIAENERDQIAQKYDFKKPDLSSTTTRLHLPTSTYLVSFSRTNFENFNFISVADEKEALRALDELYRRSMVFLVISVLVIFIISLLLSNSLTYRIHELTQIAAEVGKGNFDIAVNFKSRDEVGVLAEAFRKMGEEIKKLFSDKLEKDRMERELKTAGIIQDKLFPTDKNISFDKFDVSGFYLTSTECGGDWWYYYRVGNDLYILIADATGHGTPAALITSASNAIFSYLQHQSIELEEIVKIWDEVVYSSSKGEVLMTAQICRINLVTGDAEIVNLNHEPPILYRGDKKAATYMILNANHSLGQRVPGSKQVYKFNLAPGDRLALYSDGVPVTMFKNGQPYSDKQYMKSFNTYFQKQEASNNITGDIYQHIRETTDPITFLEDDVTLVVVARNV